jgi:hypothetical protein
MVLSKHEESMIDRLSWAMTPYENGLTFAKSDMVIGKKETVGMVRARANVSEKEWGNKMIGQKGNCNWTTRLGEDLVRDTLKEMGKNPRKPKSIGGYSPDWETDDAIWEVKTRSWTVSGTAGEKVLGTMFKYAQIPELYGKPLKIVCLAYQEWELSHGTTRIFGDVCVQQRRMLNTAKENGIEYVKFSDMVAMTEYAYISEDSQNKLPESELENDELVEFIKDNTYDPWVNTRFEGYVYMKPKSCGAFGEMYVSKKMEERGYEVVAAPTSTAGHDRVIDGKKTEIKFSLASRRPQKLRKFGKTGTIRNKFIINHLGMGKDWERLIFVCINEAEDETEDDHLIRWFSNEDFSSTLHKFFRRQQGGKKTKNDDWMCSGAELDKLLGHELVKKLDDW